MTAAIRNNLAAVARTKSGSHAGLLLSRYLLAHDAKNENKRDLLEQAQQAAARAQGIYTLAYDRWEAETRGLPGEMPRPVKAEISAAA